MPLLTLAILPLEKLVDLRVHEREALRRSSYARWQRSGSATLPEYGLGRAQLDAHFAEYTRSYVRGAAWERGVATQAQLRASGRGVDHA